MNKKGWYLVHESVQGLRSKFNSLGRSLHLSKGVHETCKAGGVDAEGSRQEKERLFLEEGSLFGFWGD